MSKEYSRRLLEAAQRMASHMGAKFVPNERWEQVVSASLRTEPTDAVPTVGEVEAFERAARAMRKLRNELENNGTDLGDMSDAIIDAFADAALRTMKGEAK